MTGHNRIPTKAPWYRMDDETFESLVMGGVLGFIYALALVLWVIV